jgi:FkbM family methyltransferase
MWDMAREFKRRLKRSLDALLNLVPTTRRARFWVRLLWDVQPVSGSDWWRFVGSTLTDVFGHSVNPAGRPVPQARKTLNLRIRESGTLLKVRGGTDDIYHVLPRREGDVHDTILGLLRPGDSFVDVGANIGYYTVLGARAVGDEGTVIALEPVPETAAILRDNVEANGLMNVMVVEAAATDGLSPSVSLSVPSTLLGRATISEVKGSQKIVTVAVRLDEACRGLGSVRLVKLDVEGNELGALQGSDDLLTRTEFVVVECNVDEEAIGDHLKNRGFHVAKLHFTSHLLGYRKDLPLSPTT